MLGALPVKWTALRLAQPANAQIPRLVTLLGIMMLVRLRHPYNAESPMLVTLSEIVRLVRLLHLANAESHSDWVKTPVANLVRYTPSGIYFARVRILGKLFRQPLQSPRAESGRERGYRSLICAFSRDRALPRLGRRPLRRSMMCLSTAGSKGTG